MLVGLSIVGNHAVFFAIAATTTTVETFATASFAQRLVFIALCALVVAALGYATLVAHSGRQWSHVGGSRGEFVSVCLGVAAER